MDAPSVGDPPAVMATAGTFTTCPAGRPASWLQWTGPGSGDHVIWVWARVLVDLRVLPRVALAGDRVQQGVGDLGRDRGG
jgi:hypothetical protein